VAGQGGAALGLLRFWALPIHELRYLIDDKLPNRKSLIGQSSRFIESRARLFLSLVCLT
jgi:hypothetical protein